MYLEAARARYGPRWRHGERADRATAPESAATAGGTATAASAAGAAPRATAPPKPATSRRRVRPRARHRARSGEAGGSRLGRNGDDAGRRRRTGDGSGPGAGGGPSDREPARHGRGAARRAHTRPPIYPPGARESGVEGAVVLLAIVAEDGRIEAPVRVAQSIPALDQAAIAALQRWRFRPGRDASGKPVRAEVEVPIRFELR